LKEDGVPDGVLTPAEILTDQGVAESVAAQARGIDGIAAEPTAKGPQSNQDGTSILIAVPDRETVGGRSMEPIRNLRSALSDTPGVLGIAGLGHCRSTTSTPSTKRSPSSSA
jgi:RND superfamily putative drug exporter